LPQPHGLLELLVPNLPHGPNVTGFAVLLAMVSSPVLWSLVLWGLVLQWVHWWLVLGITYRYRSLLASAAGGRDLGQMAADLTQAAGLLHACGWHSIPHDRGGIRPLWFEWAVVPPILDWVQRHRFGITTGRAQFSQAGSPALSEIEGRTTDLNDASGLTGSDVERERSAHADHLRREAETDIGAWVHRHHWSFWGVYVPGLALTWLSGVYAAALIVLYIMANQKGR
jgi:hypothetical protein